MKKNLQKGFTLIELLVVIAIIGILASVVLASLGSARNKGKDASAKASMSSVRASAEIYYNSTTAANSYGPATTDIGASQGVCLDTDVLKLLTAAGTQTGTTATCTVGSTAATGPASSYEADIVLTDGTTFCVDSNGFAGKPTSVTAGAASTPAKCNP